VKTALPIHTPPRLPRTRRALTILEMLVSTAMLAFIILGLTAMLVQTQKAFKSGIKRTTITDAGRTIVDMIASDLSQMSDPHFTNIWYPTNFNGAPPTLYWYYVPWYDLDQVVYTNSFNQPVYRTNQIEDIFATVLSNNTWLGIGYTVSNWFTNAGGSAIPGVGTLYRYVAQTNAPLYATNTLFSNFNTQVGYNTFTNTLFHRVADGVIHFKIYAFDAGGNEMPYEQGYEQFGNLQTPFPGFLTIGTPGYVSLQYPCVVGITNAQGFITSVQTNYLPHSIDIELGILEPETFEHVRALYAAGATTVASNFLANAAGQVEIFRQHIIIPAAP
jgi:hypothetical protein